MSEGKIKVAVNQGRYLLVFEGDVRVTLCASLDDYVEKMFADPTFVCVSVDLSKAQGMDSTSLGMLAKLALRAETDYEMQPLLFSVDEEIDSVLISMGLDEVFSIQHCVPDLASCDVLLQSLDVLETVDEKMMRKHVIESHRALMSLNEKNRLAFSDLMQNL